MGAGAADLGALALGQVPEENQGKQEDDRQPRESAGGHEIQL